MIIAEILSCTVLFLMATVGLAFAVRWVCGWVLGAKRKCLLSVVLLKGADTEFLLRCAVGVHTACPIKGSGKIYAVDCGMDLHQRQIAQRIAKCYPCLELIDGAEFAKRAQERNFPEYNLRQK
ncbi:MAG: hypothetical protein IIW23_01395 [Clostridia bacterium]|nr:hypothetical protein [Clostridia bacterium]